MGDVYVSDGSGKYFSLSIDSVLKGVEYVDFEKVNSLEGVYLTNKFDLDQKHTISMTSKSKPGTSKTNEFNGVEMD